MGRLAMGARLKENFENSEKFSTEILKAILVQVLNLEHFIFSTNQHRVLILIDFNLCFETLKTISVYRSLFLLVAI